jgi:type II secretory pathway predicted ATPase ExeA
MRSRLILVTGPPGVGKTTVSRLLFERLTDSAWLDGDDVWRINPFVVDDRTKAIVESTIAHVLRSYLEVGYPYVILSWVLHRQDLIDRILDAIGSGEYDVRIFTLVGDEAALADRFESQAGRGPIADEICAAVKGAS